MSAQEDLSLEELVRLYNVVAASISSLDLEIGMVVRFDNRLRVVISVAFENTESGARVVVETAHGLTRFPADSELEAWHINGKPFFVELSPEDLAPYLPNAPENGCAPPAHDAAGIAPVCRGPKRLN
jgi:hypothetical protein